MTEEDGYEPFYANVDRKGVGITVLVILIVLVLLYLRLREAFQNEIQVQIATLLVNGILTVVLIYVYVSMASEQRQQRQETSRQADLQGRMASFQEDQNKILKRQQDLLELEYEPKIQIEEYEITDNNIRLTLRNLGRGLAQNIAIRTIIRDEDNRLFKKRFQKSDYEDAMYSPEEIMYQNSSGTEYIPKIKMANRPDEQRLLSKSSRGGMLSPEEGSVRFVSSIKIGYSLPEEEGLYEMRPTQFLHQLYEDGVREVGFSADLVYTNELGDVQVTHILGKSGEIERGMGMSDIVNLGGSFTSTRHDILDRVQERIDYPPSYD